MSRKAPVVLFCSIALFLISGCSKYIIYETSSVILPKGSTIGVLVDLPWGEQSSTNDLSSFMSTALMRRGYRVKSINPSDLLPQSIHSSIATEMNRKYAFMEEFVDMLGTNKARISGNKEFWRNLMHINEVKESSMRFKDLNSLVDDFIKRWNTDYTMFVTPVLDNGAFTTELLVRVIEIKEREVIYMGYAKFSDYYFETEVPEPKADRSSAYTLQDDASYKMIKMCEYLAGKLSKGAKK